MDEPKIVKLFAGKEVGFEEAVGKPVQDTKRLGLPKFAIVTSYDAKSKIVEYYGLPGFRKSVYYLGPGARCKVLTGKKGREMMEGFAQFKAIEPIRNKVTVMPISLGADPEIFVTKGSEVIPAWTFLGAKSRVSNGIDAYWDGFQAEFTCSHNTCIAYVLDNIRKGMLEVYNRLPTGSQLSIDSVVRVDTDTLEKAEDKYVQFGCMPSKNAYGIKGEETDARRLPIRFAGGHIHFGIAKKADYTDTVKMLDRVLGLPSVLLFQNMDQPVRRQFYGLPGEYREPPHGLEYRTLSNAWLCHPAIANLTLEIARCGLTAGLSGILEYWKGEDKQVVDIIQNGDTEGAWAMLQANKTLWMDIMSVRGALTKPAVSEFVFNSLPKGVEGLITSPKDIARNWYLKGGWTEHSENPDVHLAKTLPIWKSGKKV